MKKIIILLLIPFASLAQTKVKDLPTTTTGLNGDYLIKNDSAGGTKIITIGNFKTTYFPTLPTHTISATSPVTFSLGVIGIPLATSLANGYLSASDWTTFNSKESVLTFTNGVSRTSNTVKVDTSLISTKYNVTNLLTSKQNTLTAGTGVTINTNTISIGQAVGTNDQVQFQRVNINTVDGLRFHIGTYSSILNTNSGAIRIGTNTNANIIEVTGARANYNPTIKSNDSSTQIAYTAYVDRAVDSLRFRGYQYYMACTDETTAITATDTNSITIYAPFNFTVTSVFGMLNTAQSSGSTFTFDIKKNNTTIFSTRPTIDNTEFTTLTAATAGVLSTTTFAAGDRIVIYRYQVGTGGKGFKVAINYTR
jgi:hypothetical protein